jgi:aminoglycoside 6'-N-acetyltransferase I
VLRRLVALSSRYGLQIRTPGLADAPALVELFILAGRPDTAAAVSARLEALSGSAGAVLIAEEWGPPSGVVSVHWFPSLLADHMVARMTAILVAPEARRRGVGRLLLKAASRAARVAGCDVLECFPGEEQLGLEGFLLATGFVQAGATFLRPLRKRP